MRHVDLRMAGRKYRFYFTVRKGERSSLVDALRARVWYEGKMLNYIRKTYGTGGNYIDVGAHLGTHTVFFCGPCRAHRVFAFEPQVAMCDCLRASLRANAFTNVHLFEFGLGTEPRSRWATGYGSKFKLVDEPQDGAEQLDIERFADWVPDCPPIKLIKVDTDGMDIEAVESLWGIIDRDRPVLAIECMNDETMEELHTLLDPLGYECGPVFNASPTYIWECKR